MQSGKGNEFINTTAQQYLKREGVDFYATHNPGVKRSVIERFNRTLKTKMYKYFTKNNTYRYLDAINDLLTSYNSINSTIGMPLSKVPPSNIYSLWRKVNSLRAKIPHGCVKFKVGDLVRITNRRWGLLKDTNRHFQQKYFGL